MEFLEWMNHAWNNSPRDLYIETDLAPIFIGDIQKGPSLAANTHSIQGEVGYVRPEIHPKVLDLITLKTAPPPSLGEHREFFDSTHFHIELINDHPIVVYEYSKFAPTPRVFAHPYLTKLFRKWNKEEKNGAFGKKPMIELREIFRTRGLDFLRKADKIKRISMALKRSVSIDEYLERFMGIVGFSLKPEPGTRTVYKVIIQPERRGEYLPIDPLDLYEILIHLQRRFSEIFDSLEITVFYGIGRSETVNILADELKVQRWIKLYVDPKTKKVYKTTDNGDAYKALFESLINNKSDVESYLANLR